MTEEQLKHQLTQLAQNKFQLAENDELATLLPAMLQHIGSPDPILRDDLIYSSLATWILEHKIVSPAQMREILATILGEEHIFYQIGSAGTDAVFRRSFSVLLLPLLLIAHRAQPYLTAAELLNIKETLLRYLAAEKDRRGFVADKGWAHATAHAADALDDLAQCTEIDAADLREMLHTICQTVSIDSTVYTYGEDERLVTAAIAILKRSLLPEAEIIAWLQAFADTPPQPLPLSQTMMLRANRKNFLQAMYFRLVREQMAGSYFAAIDQALQKIGV